MNNFFKGTKFRIFAALVACCLFGVFIAAVSNSGSSPISDAVSYIMTPLHNAALALSEMTEDFNGYFVSAKTYQNKATELENEIYELRSQLVEFEKTKHKLEAYEDFLGVKKDNPDFSFVAAEIILRDTTDYYGTFVLNVGSDDGISINDPVIYSDNLIGVVKELTNKTATVYTLFNPDISVSAYEIRTRESCYIETDLTMENNGYLLLSGLTKNTPVVSGGIVCTSGIGGIYPKDLIIGTVKEIKTDITGLSSYALVEPSADYLRLTDVFVITDFEGKASGENK